MSINPDQLVERMIAAAEQTIRREAGSIAFDVNRVRGVTIDLGVTARGVVEPARVYVERAAVRGSSGD